MMLTPFNSWNIMGPDKGQHPLVWSQPTPVSCRKNLQNISLSRKAEDDLECRSQDDSYPLVRGNWEGPERGSRVLASRVPVTWVCLVCANKLIWTLVDKGTFQCKCSVKWCTFSKMLKKKIPCIHGWHKTLWVPPANSVYGEDENRNIKQSHVRRAFDAELGNLNFIFRVRRLPGENVSMWRSWGVFKSEASGV